MAVFTRYSTVMETDGSPHTVRTPRLTHRSRRIPGRTRGEFDTDTRWALAGSTIRNGRRPIRRAETLSKAKKQAIRDREAGVVRARGPRSNCSSGRNARRLGTRQRKRLTMGVTQHHDPDTRQKANGAAVLLHKLGVLGETAATSPTASTSTANARKWPRKPSPYNGLVIAWPS